MKIKTCLFATTVGVGTVLLAFVKVGHADLVDSAPVKHKKKPVATTQTQAAVCPVIASSSPVVAAVTHDASGPLPIASGSGTSASVTHDALDQAVISDALSPFIDSVPVPLRSTVTQVASSAMNQDHDQDKVHTSSSSLSSSSDPQSLHTWVAQKVGPISGWNIEGLLGLQWMIVGQRSDSAPAFGLSIQSAKSPWSVEIGGTLPHGVHGSFEEVQQTINGQNYDAQITRMTEAHLAADYAMPLNLPLITDHLPLSLSFGAGVSMLHITNGVDIYTPRSVIMNGQTYSFTMHDGEESSKTSFSPLVRMGVTLFPQSWINLRLDAGYAGYSNTFTANGQMFDLGFSGITYRAMVGIRI